MAADEVPYGWTAEDWAAWHTPAPCPPMEEREVDGVTHCLFGLDEPIRDLAGRADGFLGIVRDPDGPMGARNDYAVFSEEFESVLKAGAWKVTEGVAPGVSPRRPRKDSPVVTVLAWIFVAVISIVGALALGLLILFLVACIQALLDVVVH